MNLAIVQFFIIVQISPALSGDFTNVLGSGFSNVEKSKIAFDGAKVQKLANDLNRVVFENRHANFQADKLKGKGIAAWGDGGKQQMNFDTVAVRIDKNGDVYIAANTRTRNLPYSGKKKSFQYSDFGLNKNDHVAILEVLRKNPEFQNQQVHFIETRRTPKDTFETAAPHAEMKLILDREKNPVVSNSPGDRRKSIIAASKPACELCATQLAKNRIPHNQEGGLNFEKIKNWYDPSDVASMQGGVSRTTYNINDQSTSGSIPSQNIAESDNRKVWYNDKETGTFHSSIPGACLKPSGRRKRAVGSGCGSGCGICIGSSGNVESVHQKEFVDSYKNADNNGKKAMTDAVNGKTVKLDAKQDKVKKLVQLENVKSQVKNVALVDKIQKVGKVGKDFGKKGWNYLQGVGNKLSQSASKLKVRISSSTLGKGLAKLAMHKGLTKFSKGADKVSGAVGKFLLAKTVINGIAQGDSTSLAIVGARVGGEYLSKAAVWAGTKFFAKGTKVFKAAKFLGKVAGPVGMAVDVGFSIYSLVKSVERLNGATNVYDRNDAIADVVSDSISLAISITVIAVAPFFPPIAAIGAIAEIVLSVVVALYKASNEVARINAEVPLLDFEKDKVFFDHLFDWFGTKRPNYIDNLVGEKKANDLAVEHNLQFLENNTDFAGIVFPSRTLHYEGSCTFYKYSCAYDLFSQCVSWNDREWIASGCDSDGECAEYGSGIVCRNPPNCKCTNDTIPKDFSLVDAFPVISTVVQGVTQNTAPKDTLPLSLECICKGPPEGQSQFGVPRKDSFVDLRSKQYLYLDRTVPKDVEKAEFLCKPGNADYKGFTKSKKDRTSSYLCKNAIGLYRRNKKLEQTLLFSLEDGDDTVYLGEWDSRPNLFVMGSDGLKNFHGGIGNDNFAFDNCNASLRGELSGGLGQDTITLGESCAAGQEINVDFRNGKLASGTNLDMEFKDIEVLVGRKHEREVVEVACVTRTVYLQGGTSSQMDYVGIPSDNCQYNVTVSIASHTKVVSKAENGSLVLPIGKEWSGVELEIDTSPNLEMQLVFMETSSREINVGSFQVASGKLDFVLKAGSQSMKFLFHMKHDKKDASIYFTEKPKGSPSSVLLLTSANNDSEPIFYHSLANFQGEKLRSGNLALKNIFDVSGPGWAVTGGDKDDEFILHTAEVGRINAGLGMDTLKFSKSFSQDAIVDMGSNKFQQIERVFGNPNVPLTVITACSTEMVVGQGGTLEQPDLIRVRGAHCSHRNLQITAAGHSHVVLEAGESKKGKDTVHVVAHGDSNKVMNFALETKSTDLKHLMVATLVSHRNWSLDSAKVDSNQQSILVKLKGEHENAINLNLKQNISTAVPESYFQLPVIQFSLENSTDLPGYMVFDRMTGSPKLIFQPAEDNQYKKEMTANGLLGVENLFVFKTSNVKWSARGGNASDQFVLRLTPQDGGQYSIHGGDGGDDVLFLEGDSEVANLPFLVNLVNNEVGYLGTQSEKRGKVENIQHIVGRANAPDILHLACDTKTVNGKGGAGNKTRLRDVINIGLANCSQTMHLNVGKYTDVSNRAVNGDFTYVVSDLVTSTLELTATQKNNHFIQFRFHPWEYITAIALDDSGSVMAWNITNGKHNRSQVFKMARQTNSEEYSNPRFDFRVPESPISSDIRVGANKVTMATFSIRGFDTPELVRGIPVDVNRYLINITKTSNITSVDKPTAEIHGCSDGKRCSANQFWIFDLATPIKMLDGGTCAESGCKNYLQFASGIHMPLNTTKWIVDMNMTNGSVETEQGETVIATLKNIQELHGTKDIEAYVSCNISKVSSVSRVVVPGTCKQLNLIVELREYSQVIFLDAEIAQMEQDGEELKGTVHYRFLEPMSFMPEGDYFAITAYNHIYYLPFTLDALSELVFELEAGQLFYVLNETVYTFPMSSFAEVTDQFYTQPSILTEDGYRLQISREGSVWAVLGDKETSAEITADLLPELRETADKLGITIMIQGPTEFFFVGHSSDSGAIDRNVLHNIANYTSHLAGGGADDTIYEVVSLDADVYIYTGYTNDTFKNWTDAETNAKQTLDLTDIIVPIRISSKTKYVSETSSDADGNLVITMKGYENAFPGKIVIVRGAFDYVATRMQLLLNSAIMDFVPVTTSDKKRKRSISSSEIKHWKIHPRPVIISRDISVFNLAPEDLEDGQDIHFEADLKQKNNSSNSSSVTFEAMRNGTDLYLSNVKSAEDQVATVIISDIYQASSSDSLNELEDNYDEDLHAQDNETEANSQRKDILTLPSQLKGVNINLPGINLLLNNSQIFNTTDKNSSVMEPLSDYAIHDWDDELVEVEGLLLEEMPEIERTFKSKCKNYYCYVPVFISVVGVLIFIAVFYMCWNRITRNHRGTYFISPTTEK